MGGGGIPYWHEDHPEGAAVVEAAYPQILRDQVILDCYDNDIKDGDSNAAYSFRYGEHEGEIFDDVGASDFWEVYPHTTETGPVLFHHSDTSVAELDFIRDAVLQTLGVRID